MEVYAAIQDERAVKFDSTQGVTIANFTADASRRVVGQWGGAGGAVCEDHLALAWANRDFARRFSFLLVLLVCYMTLAACEALSRALKAA